MISITEGPNRYYVYSLSALSTDTFPTEFPFESSNGKIDVLGDGSTIFTKDTHELKVYNKESNAWG